jgi:predicted Zn finger-like uncharacterized protein
MDKTIFTTHINAKGRLVPAKETFDCPHCSGECFIQNESVSPSGMQTLEYECTDCEKTWTETY